MRIALVSQEYPPETARGGIGSQTYLKAQGLAARGHELIVVSQSVDDQQHDDYDGEVRVIRVPWSRWSPMETEIAQWITYSTQVAATVAELHQAASLDLVDFPEWGCEGYVYLLNRTPTNYVPTVIHLHGPLVMFAHTMGWPDQNSEFYRVGTHMEQTCLRLADAVFSSSFCSAEWCARHYGLDVDRVPRLHTGIDTELFQPLAAAKASRPTVVFAGKIARNKGVTVLFDAVCELISEFPSLRLVMLGRGEREVIQELRDAAAQRGLEHVLELAGFVPREELPKRLAEAHIFAAPSVYEGGPGLVYLEAMACGLPVIACKGSGAAEVVEPGVNGFLVSPNDTITLTKMLKQLLSDTVLCDTLGQKAREYAVTQADSQQCLNRLESFYREVAQRSVCRS